jgi:hypothetical protein
VRTTLTLDDDVASRLKAEALRTGRPFRVVVNERLRQALAQRRERATIPAFRVRPCHLGGPQPGRTYDNVAELLESLEGPTHR